MSVWVVVAHVVFVTGAGVLYLSLRRRPAQRNAEVLADTRARERQALEINDNIVQGLARVKWALEAHQEAEALEAADETLAEAQKMVTDLLMGRPEDDESLAAGRLRRELPAGTAAAPE